MFWFNRCNNDCVWRLTCFFWRAINTGSIYSEAVIRIYITIPNHKTANKFFSFNTQTKQQKQNALETKCVKNEIEDMEDELTTLSDDIYYYESKYYETCNSTYVDQ